jgi:hypothetical protein
MGTQREEQNRSLPVSRPASGWCHPETPSLCKIRRERHAAPSGSCERRGDPKCPDECDRGCRLPGAARCGMIPPTVSLRPPWRPAKPRRQNWRQTTPIRRRCRQGRTCESLYRTRARRTGHAGRLLAKRRRRHSHHTVGDTCAEQGRGIRRNQGRETRVSSTQYAFPTPFLLG